jgi:SAM-dependent MidA family methyltransferase
MAFPGRGRLEVEEELLRRIADKGRIGFAEFMEVALYLPEFGYYASGLAARRGRDYLTSPEVHPAFGALVGRALVCLWRALGEPERFEVFEPGAGSGRLCRDSLAQVEKESPACYRAARYSLSEIGPVWVACQQELLGEERARGRVRWVKEGEPGSVEGCILAHEVADALPVHRVVMRGGRLRELYVRAQGRHFLEEEGEPSRLELARHFEEAQITLAEGERAEVGLAAKEWLRAQAARLARGFLLIADYGGSGRELGEGTVRSYYRHGLSESPYLRPGYQDITASVDFSALLRAGVEAGLERIALVRQEELLLRLGLGRWLERLKKMKLESGLRAANVARMQALIAPGGLGDVKLLLLGRGVSALTLEDIFPPAGSWARRGSPPLLASGARTWEGRLRGPEREADRNRREGPAGESQAGRRPAK